MTLELGPGTVLGRYELLAPVAKGGMAQVWMARLHGSRGFHKLVAVKTILTKASHELRSEAMLLEEARLAALVHHPNIVTTLDLGEERSLLYLVMEWVHGETLRDVFHKSLGTGGVPWNIAVNVVAQACKGLHAAHEATSPSGLPLHLVHRDISPQNVLLSYSGVVKVADFGIAKAKVTTAELTQPGELKGKVAFMSPEQLACQPLDRRSDVFAMGTLLYTVSTGHHPFRGATTAKTYDNITACNPPKPSAIARNYPADLEHVVMRALELDPARRWQSAAEMFAALIDTSLGSQGHYESSLSAYMHRVMGDKERERAELLQRCQSATPTSLRPSAPPQSPDRTTLPTIAAVTTARDSNPPSVESLSPAVMRNPDPGSEEGQSTSTLVSFMRGRQRRLWLAACAVGGTLAIAAGVTKVPFTSAPPPGATVTVDDASPSVPAPQAPESTPARLGAPLGEEVLHRDHRSNQPTADGSPHNSEADPARAEPAVLGTSNTAVALKELRDSAPTAAATGRVARVFLPEDLPHAGQRRRDTSTATPETSSGTNVNRTVDAWDRRQFGGRH